MTYFLALCFMACLVRTGFRSSSGLASCHCSSLSLRFSLASYHWSSSSSSLPLHSFTTFFLMVLKALDTPFLMDDGTWVVSQLNHPLRVPEMSDSDQVNPSVIPRTWGPDPLLAVVVIVLLHMRFSLGYFVLEHFSPTCKTRFRTGAMLFQTPAGLGM